jgi:D-alanyl-D-alanine carboxypeptidase (penicillin-binding protein 5/6)
MKKNLIRAAFLAIAFTLPSFAATAQPVTGDPSPTSTSPTRPQAAYVYHPATGTVLADVNGEARMGPASLTKLMTLYLTFDAVKSGQITLQTQIPVSERAWRTEGSKMFIEVGKTVPVEDLIRGISIVSGNDACVAVAEHLGGTEAGFAEMMNAKAGQLGMAHTHFANANGLPDPAQYTTAHDVAMLLTAIFRDFPEYKHYLAEEEFTYNNIRQQNRNGLLHANLGIDAGKTGHTEESGYHLASTGLNNGERLVVVVMGRTGFADREGASLEYYRQLFATHATRTFFKPGDAVVENVPVWHGNVAQTALTVTEPVAAYLNNANPGEVKATVKYQQPILAPALPDKPVGELTVTLSNGQVLTAGLVPAQPVAQAGVFGPYGQS